MEFLSETIHEPIKNVDSSEVSMQIDHTEELKNMAEGETSEMFLRRRELSHMAADASVPSEAVPLTIETFPHAAASGNSPTPAVWAGNVSSPASSTDEEAAFDYEGAFFIFKTKI
jgi:hypothetical protein